MIDQQVNPVAWALLNDELTDAQEHLAQMCQEMQQDPDFSEIEFRIWLAHIYSHLNRAWNRRNATDAQITPEIEQTTWDEWSQFPTDIEPL
ncbi:MAG TPA: hypothetical protein VFO93_22105 [Hymenobacter sp.]|uniref:hypothetical protein n=1 Tax=Hymenobacter sp. TaxID=1898978 RepID=UPI002D7FB9F1|nr:hypothetical protein [Hymenobacter sp.]HET9506249.1 hypothetical protein [Hymenobacter sp.]